MSGLITGIAGLAITAGTTAGSFAQAGKQRRLAKDAQMEADRAMDSARKKLDVNFLEAVAIQKEPYELQREATLQAAATALEGVREGSARGAAAGAGRIALATQQGLNQNRADMSKELQALEMATAQEESRLRDIGVQLDLQETQGAQQAVADAELAKRQATQQGMQGIASLGQQAVKMAPLYAKSGEAKALNKAMKKNPNLKSQLASMNTIGGVDVSGVANMVDGDFMEFMITNFNPDQLKQFGLGEMASDAITPIPLTQAQVTQPLDSQGVTGMQMIQGTPFDMSVNLNLGEPQRNMLGQDFGIYSTPTMPTVQYNPFNIY
jgi:hypothetical protein